MSKPQKIKKIIVAVLMLLFSYLMLTDAEDGYKLVALILSSSLFLYALRMLVYYFTMARNMVGGRSILFSGVILLDFGMFTMSITDLPKIYVVLYLLGLNALSGVVSLLRALESKQNGGLTWRRDYAHGIASLLFALLSLIFIRSVSMLVRLYGLQMIYLAIVQVVRVFTASEMHVQSY